MKFAAFLLTFFLLNSCVRGKEKSFTGSTPANAAIREFLGIDLADSIDFIRWKLNVDENRYSLSANYGIGKPNTNGFMGGGKTIKFSGEMSRDKDKYWMRNGDKKIAFLILNDQLIHPVSPDGRLMRGTEGWSYTLNLEKFPGTGQVSVQPKKIVFIDSMAYQGRTPCLDFADIRRGKDCFKLKWSIVLFADPLTNKPTGYRLRGTAVKHESKTGTWTGDWNHRNEKGNPVYQLKLDRGEPLYFIMPDENILLLTDKNGNLLVGNEDFSYTLNRKD